MVALCRYGQRTVRDIAHSRVVFCVGCMCVPVRVPARIGATRIVFITSPLTCAVFQKQGGRGQIGALGGPPTSGVPQQSHSRWGAGVAALSLRLVSYFRASASRASPLIVTGKMFRAAMSWLPSLTRLRAPLCEQRRAMHFGSKMGRAYPERLQMMKNMVTSLIEHERIKTTLAKAKQVARLSDRLVTKAKKGGLNQRRQASRYVKTPSSMVKLFTSTPRLPFRLSSPAPLLLLRCGLTLGSLSHLALARVPPQFWPIGSRTEGGAIRAS